MHKIFSVQNWLPIEEIFENGNIKLKNNSYIKILKISPINFNLKSNIEKEAILNSYKTFLKTCDFNIQILIQSNKEDLSKHISLIKKLNPEKNKILLNSYIDFIQEINQKRKSSSKNFYILISEIPENKKQKITKDNEKILCEKLSEKYFKIKECLARCGNIVTQYEKREEVENLLNSFLNVRKEFNIL